MRERERKKWERKSKLETNVQFSLVKVFFCCSLVKFVVKIMRLKLIKVKGY